MSLDIGCYCFSEVSVYVVELSSMCREKKKKRKQVKTFLKQKIREIQSADGIKYDATHMHKLYILTIKQTLYLGNCQIRKKYCMDPWGVLWLLVK